MKKTLLLLCVCITSQFFGQTEFKTYKNDLIYNEKTMNQLEFIVDSLNLKYKYCDLNKTFYSKDQTVAYVIKLDTNDIKQAKKHIEENMPLETFLLKYPEAVVEKDVLVVKFNYKNYKGEKMVEYSQISFNSNYGLEVKLPIDQYDHSVKNKWVYKNHSDKYIRAFYFPNDFSQTTINAPYNRYIGYANCLIDTTTTKFLKNAESGHINLPNNWQNLSSKKKNKLLKEMRSTRVIGGCSMDRSPRIHAMNIALLSAETINWSIFLRSHLDIMNDRFDRTTDGSYALAERKTYIKELEELNINVNELILGISLRIENPAENHYYGSINRLGRAISESNNRIAFKKDILSMIEDNELDDYNRVISYFLFVYYNNYIENIDEQIENQKQLKASIKKLPAYIKNKIELKNIEH